MKNDWLVRLRPRAETLYISLGRTVLVTGRDGFITDEAEHGLFVHQTRLVSRHRFWIDGESPWPLALSNVEQHSWLGYYVQAPPGAELGPPDIGSGQMRPVSEQTLELRLSRFVGNGLHEDVDLTNFAPQPSSFRLAVEVDGDFADQYETADRRQTGRLTHSWAKRRAGVWELVFRYEAEHAFAHPQERGTARIERGLTLRIDQAGSPPSYENGRLTFEVRLAPRESWHACLTFVPEIDGEVLEPIYRCRSFGGHGHESDQRRAVFLQEATTFTTTASDTLAPIVVGALEQAKRDLSCLRLYDLDRGERAWTMAAGVPQYVALFGRDTLTAAWQAGLVSPAMMQGTLSVLAQHQGTRTNDWRDEQPGRMLHEAHTGPLATLNLNPRQRYYGTVTAPGFYPVVVSELWHWTGDKEQVGPFIEPALKGLRWLDQKADLNGDGFHEYLTRSRQGVKHQAWKDSPDAVVSADGSPVEPPIATCEEQAFVYAAKLHLSEVLWWFGRRGEAKRLFREASELKKRFNDAFWMEQEGFFALGLDSTGRPIRSITSNPGHCLATAVADDSLVRRTAERLFADDLFSGWGIRTLSEQNPAYNPYSYHRGSVWPVEHGSFALGFYRYGLHEYVERICRAQFEAAALFDFYRLPECFSGHPRDADHPFPAVYPQACSPQAWSSSAVFCMLQALLGLYPYAPLHLLLVDPHLPPWLPEITLSGLHVGKAVVTLRFYRRRNGTSSYKVVDKRGKLHVLRQPTPWSLTAGFAERLKDALTSLLPGK